MYFNGVYLGLGIIGLKREWILGFTVGVGADVLRETQTKQCLDRFLGKQTEVQLKWTKEGWCECTLNANVTSLKQ